MTADDAQYRAIVEICRESQQIVETRRAKVGGERALREDEPYQSMWKEYSRRVRGSVDLRHADFSGLIFKNAEFHDHNFVQCDFRRSRWYASWIWGGDCSESSFSGITAHGTPFRGTNCANCDFTDAQISVFDPIIWSPSFKNADFTNATLLMPGDLLAVRRPGQGARFDNATMDGCRLTVGSPLTDYRLTKEELDSFLASVFSPEQLAVMHIDYEDSGTEERTSSGCFIATAACGINSEEVAVLRHFRDTALSNSVLGRLLLEAYYRISPRIASLIENSPQAQSTIRNALVRPAAKLVESKNRTEARRLLSRRVLNSR